MVASRTLPSALRGLWTACSRYTSGSSSSTACGGRRAIQVTVQTSDTLQVTEIVTTSLPFNLVENWNPAHLRLLGWEVSPGGMVITNTGYLEWHQTPTGPGPWYIIKWFHVEPCDWTNTILDEVLFVSDLPPEPRPVPDQQGAASVVDQRPVPAAGHGRPAGQLYAALRQRRRL